MRAVRVLQIILMLLMCGCREVVVHNLSENEANKMLTQLVLNELDVKKEKQPDGKWSLSLPSDQSSQAIRYLSEHRLLKEEASNLPEKSGILVSREEQRFRYERALSREIEGTLSGIGSVLQARVHLNLPVIDPLFGQSIDNSKSSASILIVLGDGGTVDKSDIAALVSGASGIPIPAISVLVSSAINKVNTAVNSTVLNEINQSKEVEQKDSTAKDSKQTISINNSDKQNQIKLVFLYWVSLLNSMPWSWIAMTVGISLIILGTLRLIHRSEKLSM